MRGKFYPFLTLAFIVAITPNNVQGASAAVPVVINASGQKLECIFQGLKPDPAFLKGRDASFRGLRKSWNGIGASPLPGFRPIQIITEGGSCPSSVCSGNYQGFERSYGCLFFNDCDVYNAVYDPNESCYTGSRDVECGDGIVCCFNAMPCPNINGC